MKDVQASFANYWQTVALPNIAPMLVSLLESLLVIVVLFIVGNRLQRVLREGPLSKRTSINFGILAGRLTYIGAVTIAAVWVSVIMGFRWSSVLTLVAGLSVAVAFAVQDILKNLVAGLYLLIERPFTIGDAVTVKEFTGIVEDVRIRTTVLRTDQGQQVIVPNGILFTEVVVNRRDERRAAEALEESQA